MSWVQFPVPNPGAAARLFCFHFAGGGASAFRGWAPALPASIEICPVQTPGREERISEAPFTHLPELVDAAAAQILPWLDKPFAFFGHSLGALVAFEVTRKLRRSSAAQPLSLFLSAHRAPHLPLSRRLFHNLPDDELISVMREMNGTPDALLENREVLDYLLPIIRADLKMCDTYQLIGDGLLSCPLIVYGGRDDRGVSEPELEAWRFHTSAPFMLQMFPGDHFFIRSQRSPLLRNLSAQLLALMAAESQM